MSSTAELKEVYKTKTGCIYQCDKNRCFWVDFAGHLTPFNASRLFDLKKLIEKINIDRMASNPEKCFDIEIINLCWSDRCYVLSLPQIIEFKDLLRGARTMLELNSILCERRTIIPS